VYGILGEANGDAGSLSAGDGVGINGESDGSYSVQYGVQGTTIPRYNLQTNVGVGAFSLINGKTGTTNVGVYAEVQDATQAGATSPQLESAVILADSRNTGTPLFVGRTNGVTTYNVRSDGSVFVGKNVGQDVDENDFSISYVPYFISMTDSNEANTISGLWSVIDSENYNNFGSLNFTAGNSPARAIMSFSDGTKNVTITARSLTDAISFYDGGYLFTVSSTGDLTHIKGVTYSWPSAHGSANSVLTDTDGAGTLSWNTVSSGISVAAGTNILATTNSGLVTINGLTDSNVVRILITNQAPNFIHGSTNRIAKFTPNTNEVGNSIMLNTSTNLIEYKPFDTAYTNTITNLWYGEWTSASNWRGLQLSTSLNGNDSTWLRTTHGSGYSNGDDILAIQAWSFGAPSPHAGQSTGGFYPNTDNTYDIGTSSARARTVYAGPAGFLAGANANMNFGAVSGYGFGVASDHINVFNASSGVIAQFTLNGVGNAAGLDIDTSHFLMGGGSPSTPTAFFSMPTDATYKFGTNNTLGTLGVTSKLVGSSGSGSDKSGGDIAIIGGVSTGTGTNGSVRIQTIEKAASTSSVANTGAKDRLFVIADPIVLTTNSATVVLNMTIPTALRGAGGTVFAHTEIENGVDIATQDDVFVISANRKGSTVVAGTPSTPTSSSSTSGGSAGIANTWTLVANAQSVDLKLTCVTSGINSTNSTVRITFMPNSSAVPVITHP